MTRSGAPRPGATRTFLPVLVMVGPLLCATALTGLGYLMFRAQADAATSGVTSPFSSPLAYTVILALAGALLALVFGGLGLMLYNRSRMGIEAREQALAEGMERLATVDQIARRIALRGERRETVSVAWGRRQREALAAMNGLAGPRAALQRVAGDIWAGVSQPGAPLDAPTAMRMARESAVAAAALGAALDDLRALVSAPSLEVDEIIAIDDALVADLIALDELTSETRRALEAATGHMAAVRAKSDSRWRDLVYRHGDAPAVSAPQLAKRLADHPMETSHRGPALPPAPSASGKWPAAQDPGHQRPPAPSGPSGRLNADAPQIRPPGSSGKWPRPQTGNGPRPESSQPQWPAPRDRDDNASRWLND
jgi:hypothetical protein